MNKLFLIIGIFCIMPIPALAKCVVGGCSGQLCVSEGNDMITTCEWLEEYGCYQVYGKCEQQDGQCGWKKTAELQSCLSDPSIAARELEKRNKERQEQYYKEHKGENCVKSGSYRQVCVDELDMGGKNHPDFDPSPHLAFQDSFICYDQYAECKKTPQGTCGWVDSGKLQNCLADPKSLLKPPPVYQYPTSHK